MEVTSHENNDASSGYVNVTSYKSTTVWHYDRLVYDRFLYYVKSCFPIQCVGAHSCCPSSVIMEIVKPVVYAILDKRTRSRSLYHNVPDCELLDVLSEYGLFKHMLPTEVGGTVHLSQSEWMAQRRAVEMEEI